MSHTHNFCDLVKTHKIGSLSMKLLKSICHELDVDCSDIQDKR